MYSYETGQDVIVGAWPGIDAVSGVAQKQIIQGAGRAAAAAGAI